MTKVTSIQRFAYKLTFFITSFISWI